MEKLLMIPGPIKFDKDVLRQMSRPTLSHLDPLLIEIFSECLKNLRKVFFCKEGQPFIVAGSGTLAMEMVASNFTEDRDRVFVINTGCFSDRFAEIFRRYGATVSQVKSPIGDTPSLQKIEKEIKKKKYKLLTITHVDTSTGVLCDVEAICKIAKKYNVLTIVDGVCSIGGEELYQDKWGVDICLTASQKVLAVPPGLAILMVSKNAMEVFKNRKTVVKNYYCDFNNWLPIMKAYEFGEKKYFATPPINLIFALNEGLKQILKEGMEKRFKRHKVLSDIFKTTMHKLGLKSVSLPEKSAHTMTALFYPEGTNNSLLAKIEEYGVVIAGGLHPQIKDKYFRVGHLGTVSKKEIAITINAIENSLKCRFGEL